MAEPPLTLGVVTFGVTEEGQGGGFGSFLGYPGVWQGSPLPPSPT